ncbi:hypothetical protein IDG88_00370 [Pelagibacterales bacterium SAG-MED03]|nr:hypothetical protein [Pelagibacterales bacterium SAG-MED03]
MKYLFPSSEVDFKNFATEIQNYSTIIHHHENMVNSIKSYLKNENIEKTINYIETLGSFYKNFSEFYLHLLSLDKILINDLKKFISKGTNTLLSLSIWGEDYARKFCLLTLKSVKDDLNEINNNYNVQMIIFVDQSAKKILENDSDFIELNKSNLVKIIMIPSDVFQTAYYLERIAFTRYYVFGFIQNICWRYCAKYEINLSLLTPDNFYSKNFFKNLIDKINDKEDLYAVFSNSSLKVQLKDKDKINDFVSSLSSMNLDELFDFYKNNIHHTNFDFFISEEKKIENNSPQYILNSNEAFFVYSIHAHPYLLSKNYLKKYPNYFTFLPIDESFPLEDDNDINFFEKMLELEGGLTLDISSFEDTKKKLVSYSEDSIFENFSKFKNNKLSMWFLKNPLKIYHNKNPNLTFNCNNKSGSPAQVINPAKSDIVLKNFQKLIEKI